MTSTSKRAPNRALWATLAGLASVTAGFAAHAAPSGPLYIDDTSGNLGTVNLSTDAVTVLGNTGLGGNLTDIGFEGGNLYGTTFTNFGGLNAANGAVTSSTSYGGVGGGGMNALVGTGSGSLLAASGSTDLLYSVTPGGAITALSGSTGAPSAGDLAFANGSLYESAIGSGGDELVKLTLSGSTVSGTVVGNFTVGGTPLNAVYGLATGDDGVTYAVDGTDIYSVDLANGALTLVDNYGGHGLGAANGTAFIGESSTGTVTGTGTGTTSVPEPASFALLGIALAGLTLARRQARV
jgi:hypothetical protein